MRSLTILRYPKVRPEVMHTNESFVPLNSSPNSLWQVEHMYKSQSMAVNSPQMLLLLFAKQWNCIKVLVLAWTIWSVERPRHNGCYVADGTVSFIFLYDHRFFLPQLYMEMPSSEYWPFVQASICLSRCVDRYSNICMCEMNPIMT